MLAITQANSARLDAAPRNLQRALPEQEHSMKILVADNQFLVREALRAILRELKHGATIIEAVDGRQTMRLLSEQADIGLVLLDLNLPDRDGFSLLGELRESHPAVKVVVLASQQDRDTVVKALDLGALGFLSKSGERQILLSALQLVFAGGTYIPREILARGDGSLAKPDLERVAAGAPRPGAADLGLTGRQLEVLGVMMQGKSNKGICRALNLAEPTVKNHVTAILKALKVTNRTEAVISAGRLGWQLPLAGALPAPRRLAALRMIERVRDHALNNEIRCCA